MCSVCFNKSVVKTTLFCFCYESGISDRRLAYLPAGDLAGDFVFGTRFAITWAVTKKGRFSRDGERSFTKNDSLRER